jgi:hypothetical protein
LETQWQRASKCSKKPLFLGDFVFSKFQGIYEFFLKLFNYFISFWPNFSQKKQKKNPEKVA